MCLLPSGGNLVQTFSLGSKAEGFKSSEAVGAGLPTECLFNSSHIDIQMVKENSHNVPKQKREYTMLTLLYQ